MDALKRNHSKRLGDVWWSANIDKHILLQGGNISWI